MRRHSVTPVEQTKPLLFATLKCVQHCPYVLEPSTTGREAHGFSVYREESWLREFLEQFVVRLLEFLDSSRSKLLLELEQRHIIN